MSQHRQGRPYGDPDLQRRAGPTTTTTTTIVTASGTVHEAEAACLPDPIGTHVRMQSLVHQVHVAHPSIVLWGACDHAVSPPQAC